MKKVIFLNGKFIPQKEAKVSVLIPGFLYGLGLFETMRSYKNRIVYFDEHLQRIKNSCQLIGLSFPYSLQKLKEMIKKVVEINGLEDAYVRLTLWKSQARTDSLISARKYQPYSREKYKQGFSVRIARFRQNENSFLAQLKTTNRLLYELSFQEARNQGFDEAIILNQCGFITEGTRCNIFFIKNAEIFTPSLTCGCLDGITRRVIFDLAKKYKIKVYEGDFTTQDLLAADEAFFTNSLIGVMPLASIERQKFGKSKIGRITAHFIKGYNLLLKNGT